MSWQAAVAAEEKRQRASDEAEGPDATSSSVEEASEDGGEHGSSEESGAGGEAADGSLAASQLPKPKAKNNKHKKGMDYYLEDAEGGDMAALLRRRLERLACYFPLEDIVHIDPDFFKSQLPEWDRFVAHAKAQGDLQDLIRRGLAGCDNPEVGSLIAQITKLMKSQ